MTDPHLLLSGYVLDALEPEDRALFEGHLPGCEDCRRELAEFGAATAGLSALSATPPPPALRDRVLSGLGQVRQQPPDPAPHPVAPAGTTPAGTTPAGTTPAGTTPAGTTPAGTTPAGTTPAGTTPAGTTPAGTGPTGRLPADGTVVPIDRDRHRRSRRLLRSAAAALGAAALVAAIALGGWAYGRSQVLGEQQAGADAVARIIGAPDAHSYRRPAPHGMQVTYVVSERRNAALVVIDNGRDPGAGRTYQLWTVRADHGRTTFVPDRTFDRPNGPIILTGDIRAAAALGITVEPAGGSRQPTTTPFAVQSL